ncbi:MAG TPA: M4 family metallopeptidase, partial [Saprospiraceae bacterium]
SALDNAFWNGKAMFYGNGASAFKPLAGAMDVAGHEMTHGVVENTANLEYQGESGALNESMADIFGAMMDPDDWTIGEEVVKVAAFPSGALRSLSDPHNGGTNLNSPGFQPKHMNEKYTGNEDNGGVHINSGIPNHAFFLYAEAITRDKAADVFYKALDDYLTKSSQFIDLRLAVIKAAGDLFGASSNEVTKAGEAFNAVGIGAGQGGDYEEELPSNPGAEFLLLTNTDGADPNSLYRTPTNNLSNIVPLTTTGFKSKPSVTDDGSVAVFVASDKTIHAIITQPGEDPDEFVIQDDPIWSNVAVSKGGNRMAAVTEAWDNTIYVYDFVSEAWGEFGLYNPTYSDGINSGGTVYADALEWDYTGEYLVYDAFNSLESNTGGSIEYWDVNFIRVWDVNANDFGDGAIAKLFSNLPAGVSIGNPTIAKLSPHILAFDYFDEFNEEYAVLGSNIETGETDIIFVNSTLGFPSFNKSDTRVAFTLGTEGAEETGFVTLNANKISSPNASATGFYTDSKWPVYFAAGSRDIGNEVTGILREQKAVSLSCYPNPFVSEVSMALTSEFAVSGKIEVTNVMGQRLYDFETGHSREALSVKFNDLPPGQYILRVHNGKRAGACRALKVN